MKSVKMVIVFWDANSMFLIDFLDPGQTINDDYYASMLEQVHITITWNHCGKLTQRVHLLQENAPVHKTWVVMTKAAGCGFELLSHPLYYPDLAPLDYHLFPHMKKHLRGKTFKDNKENKGAVLDLLEGFEKCVARNADSS